MGLFGFFKKKRKKSTTKATDREAIKILKRVDPNYMAIQKDLEYQDKLLSKVNAARERYKQDRNLEAAIKAYESAFVKANPPCRSSQDIDLANLYIKAERYDKAWGYLNQLALRRTGPDPEIRHYQARILKKEERYASAIEMIALEYFYKSIPNQPFQSEKFKKDASSSAKKLGLNEETVDELTSIIMSYPNADNSAERMLIHQLRAHINEHCQVSKD